MLITFAHAGHDHVQETVSMLRGGDGALLIAGVAALFVVVVAGCIMLSTRRKAKAKSSVVESVSSDREDS